METAAEATALDDEYVLTHRGDRDFRTPDGGGMYRASGRWDEKYYPCHGKSEHTVWGQLQSD